MRYMKTYTWILQDVGTSFLHCAIFKHLAKNGIIIPPVKSFLLYAMSCVKNLNLGGLYALQEMPRWRWLQNQKSNQNTETINPDNILRQEILLFYLLPTLPTPPFSLCFTFTSPQKKHTHFLGFNKNHHLDLDILDGSGEPPKRVPLLRDQGSSHQPLTKRSPVQQHGLHPLCHSGRRAGWRCAVRFPFPLPKVANTSWVVGWLRSSPSQPR